jgi:restriction endonuclease S subunit
MKAKIKELAVIHMGYSFRSRLESVKNGCVKVIQMKDLLDDNVVDCSDLTKIDFGGIKDHHFAYKGDLIFRSRGQISTSAILIEDPGQSIVAAPLLRIRIVKPDKILPEYLNWYLSQRDAQIFLTSMAKGTTQNMISKQVLEELEISFPSIEKQKKIIELAALSSREQIILRILAEKRRQHISAILTQFSDGEQKR